MAVCTGAVLAAGVAAAAALHGDPADARQAVVPAGALERSAPAIAVGKPAAREDTAASAAGTSAKKPAQATAAARYKWGQPQNYDEFRGTRLDRRNWEIYVGKGNGGLGRRVASAVTVRNGALTLTGKRNGDTGGVAWTPGGQAKGARKTGRWEARVRMNRACACYNANLLLWPAGGGGGTDPQGGGGEIDWMETYGDNGLRNGTNFFLHYGPEKNAKRLNAHVKVDLRAWHAFAVDWNAKGITGYLDGRKWFHTSNKAALPPGPMGQAIQLDWFPNLTGKTAKGVSRTAPATLQVDWIRYYKPAKARS
ncbi:glycoside hydrolase family 16 protein [Actinomadura fibrosa]|uniref:Glycoside hydrolase family 16 protein n=1 Tax=Actinomadura fibrosa TaxID=111802 RepID=A0ABW2XYP1_9ACTN|nr:glycoside hydrolase family 16 protein [Actinomadura fibrosa]